MNRSALEEAHALGVTTRKHMRSVPIEDPLKAIERISEYVRTHSYSQAYAYLKSPPNIRVPQHNKKTDTGAEYILGSLLLAPIWLLAAPLFLAGVVKGLTPPSPDENLNQSHRLDLLNYLDDLHNRAKSELTADAARARELSAHLNTYGIDGLGKVRTHSVSKDWPSIYVARVGLVQKRRNGWHLQEMGKLHVGELAAAFYGGEGKVVTLGLVSISEVVVANHCMLLINYKRSRKSQLALFAPTRPFEILAHIDGVRSRIAVNQADHTRESIVQSAASIATRGVRALNPLRSRGKGKTHTPKT